MPRAFRWLARSTGAFVLTTAAHAQRPAPEPRAALSITRVMADPAAAPDELGEWLELANLGTGPVSLRGYRLASGGDAGLTIATALVVPAHGHVLLGRSADRARNGDVAVALAYTGIVLGNGADWVAIRDPHGNTVDSVAWTRAPRGVAIIGTRAGAAAPPDTTPPAPPAPPTSPAAPGELVVRILDVGQGDAILIQNGGSTVLVDGGPNPAALGRHLDALRLNGTAIDAVILSHAHADHYQGLRELFASRRRITVRYLWENQDPSPNATLARLRDSIAARVPRGLTYRDTDDPCATGRDLCVVTLKGGARLEIMRPDPLARDANNRSPALKLVGPDSASFTMWMAGDAEQEAIDFFERTGYARMPGMKVDVLKADHHGSCNGVSDRYLELLAPSLVVASVGAVNDYGHMHEQAKAAFARHRLPWYRTDQNGTITLRSAGRPGSGYSVTVERGVANASGPSDRRSTQAGCAGM